MKELFARLAHPDELPNFFQHSSAHHSALEVPQLFIERWGIKDKCSFCGEFIVDEPTAQELERALERAELDGLAGGWVSVCVRLPGVACCYADSLDVYLQQIGIGEDEDDLVVVIFEGEIRGYLFDGLVVKPSKIVEVLSVREYLRRLST